MSLFPDENISALGPLFQQLCEKKVVVDPSHPSVINDLAGSGLEEKKKEGGSEQVKHIDLLYSYCVWLFIDKSLETLEEAQLSDERLTVAERR